MRARGAPEAAASPTRDGASPSRVLAPEWNTRDRDRHTGRAGHNGNVPVLVVFAPDLLDRSRISAGAVAAGLTVVLARKAEDIPAHLEDNGTLVLIDLSRPGALEVLPALGSARCVGFAPHVDADLMRRARSAGCPGVFARSAFFARLGEILSESDDAPSPGAAPTAP